MIWNSQDDQVIGGYKQFFANNSWLERDRTLGMASLCLSYQDASIDIQHEMTYFGHCVTLVWNKILTLTFQGQIIYLSKRLYEERNTMIYSWKNISSLISILTICDQWRLNHWPAVTFYGRPYIIRIVQKLSIGIICVLLAITVPDAMARFLKNIITSIENWPLMTSGNLNIALRENDRNTFKSR